tara:strand:- start:417 stop:1103 length:687 start_codon:yes stop_codon:yes gene_type:complete
MDAKTKEIQYQALIETANQGGVSSLGLMTNQIWRDDPRRLAILLSRYKFVSKMLSGMNKVVEIGCADAFGTRLIQQEVSEVTVIDFDPVFINDVKSRMENKWPLLPVEHDILKNTVPNSPFQAAYSLDVIEHIEKKYEKIFLENIAKSLEKNGVLIVGTPSLNSQEYASEQSKIGHINCKSANQLKELMSHYFSNVFIFSMNDEVVHTGFYEMAHYYFAICCGPKIEE